MTDTPDDAPPQTDDEEVRCRARKDPAVRLFIFAGMLLGLGLWFLYDGYVAKKYPHKPFSENINQWFTWAINCIGPFILIPVGLVFLVWGIVILRRVLVADADGIGYVGKQKLAWSDVGSVDASQLKAKQILILEYGDAGRMKLDSWKLDNYQKLVALIEQHVPDDKITK